ncbi:MAG: 3-deoxy-D-manno-octulosonic acid transferase [Aquificae bacterium]|nr:3-deoxy-D-manno-octulosonic acid transferase [Aquificota bacterium]
MYSFLYTLFLLFFLPIYIFFVKKKGYHFGLKERVFFDKKSSLKDPVWFHCASVGELNTAKPLIEYFSKEYDILITVSSPRGWKYAKQNFSNFEVRFLPFDYKFLHKKFYKTYKPTLLIVLEGEFWYNFITTISKFIPIVSANTRISPSSYKFYKKLSFFYKKIFNAFSKFLVRSDQDKKFLEKFILDKSKIVVCGDLKFVSSNIKKDIQLEKNNRKVLIAGSTHEPEERILLEVFSKLKKKYPHLTLIIAPRHLERINQIIELIKKFGFSYSFRTQTKKLDTDVYIVDTLGELSGLYRYADVVFVGGTIADIGGHNILEPALEKKPVIIGKHYHKIKDLYNMLKGYNIVSVVDDEAQLLEKISNLLEKEETIDIDFKSLQKKILNCYITNIKNFLG